MRMHRPLASLPARLRGQLIISLARGLRRRHLFCRRPRQACVPDRAVPPWSPAEVPAVRQLRPVVVEPARAAPIVAAVAASRLRAERLAAALPAAWPCAAVAGRWRSRLAALFTLLRLSSLLLRKRRWCRRRRLLRWYRRRSLRRRDPGLRHGWRGSRRRCWRWCYRLSTLFPLTALLGVSALLRRLRGGRGPGSLRWRRGRRWCRDWRWCG